MIEGLLAFGDHLTLVQRTTLTSYFLEGRTIASMCHPPYRGYNEVRRTITSALIKIGVLPNQVQRNGRYIYGRCELQHLRGGT